VKKFTISIWHSSPAEVYTNSINGFKFIDLPLSLDCEHFVRAITHNHMTLNASIIELWAKFLNIIVLWTAKFLLFRKIRLRECRPGNLATGISFTSFLEHKPKVLQIRVCKVLKKHRKNVVTNANKAIVTPNIWNAIFYANQKAMREALYYLSTSH